MRFSRRKRAQIRATVPSDRANARVGAAGRGRNPPAHPGLRGAVETMRYRRRTAQHSSSEMDSGSATFSSIISTDPKNRDISGKAIRRMRSIPAWWRASWARVLRESGVSGLTAAGPAILSQPSQNPMSFTPTLSFRPIAKPCTITCPATALPTRCAWPRYNPSSSDGRMTGAGIVSRTNDHCRRERRADRPAWK